MSDIEEKKLRKWALALSRLAVRRPYLTLLFVGLSALGSLVLATRLEMRMNWADLLPDGNPTVERYRDILDRFGEAGSIVVALEGERDATVAMAEELAPRLDELESLRTIMGKAPVEFMKDHGYVLLKPDQFDRILRTSQDWTLAGSFRGMNDDFEREYTDNEDNLRRDEVDIARSVLGITRSLELISAAARGEAGPEAMEEAADAWALGEPWMLSLDREMLLISCLPEARWGEMGPAMASLAEVEAIMFEVGERHPGVYASTTGIIRIGQDEMNSVGFYTLLLSLGALILIYFLLARTFRGWVMPVLALTPLLVGIFWTMGLIWILFRSMNIMTAMMGLVLLGLGIDFAIHMISRYQEERSKGGALEGVLARTLGTTGVAVIIGGFTTALAFFTLMVGRTVGFDEFGAASGSGVILTLLAIFVTLPPLLVVRERTLIRQGSSDAGSLGDDGMIRFATREGTKEDETRATPGESGLGGEGYSWIGKVAALGWRHPLPFLGAAAVLIAGCVYGMLHTEWEWDLLELEAEGLRSVELQREIPGRFGTSDHGAWVVTGSLEESRELKEEFRRLPDVGDVSALSDFVPPLERVEAYRPRLEAFRAGPLQVERDPWQPGDAEALAVELERLWDNLDLMSNLAFTAGMDRIVAVVDQITGLDSETGETDQSALLPTLSRQLGGVGEGVEGSVDDSGLQVIAGVWATRMRANLERMTNPEPVTLDEVPESYQKLFLPKEGQGILLHIVPRGYLYDRQALERFAAQTEEVHPNVVSTEKLILVMNDETMRDGKSAVLLALATIAVLLLLYFRGPVGLLAMIPLAVGVLAMLGLMFLFGIKYNYVNMIAVPIILGIGIDDGVHALHRFREGAGSGERRVEHAFRHVGKAILLTSITTMIGFGSVAFYEMRGMASFGQVLFLGVGTCFLATVLVLPAVMRLLGRGER